jgi:hypothetical protein
MQQCQVRVFHNLSFYPNEWCLKNGLHSGGVNPGPLGHESSALTTATCLKNILMMQLPRRLFVSLAVKPLEHK